MTLKFAKEALNDLKRLRQFIADKSPPAAIKYSQKLITAIHKLESHPELGKVLEEEPSVREFIAGKYVVRYMLKNEFVYILKIWHGREYR